MNNSKKNISSKIVDKTVNDISNNPFYIYAALTQIHPPFFPQPGIVGKDV